MLLKKIFHESDLSQFKPLLLTERKSFFNKHTFSKIKRSAGWPRWRKLSQLENSKINCKTSKMNHSVKNASEVKGCGQR